jgi:hypothetical protein
MSGEPDLDALAEELAPVYGAPEVEVQRTPLEERVLAGFEEIQRWVTEHGRPPRHGEGLDIFERLYAVRLDRIRADQALRTLVEPNDHQGLLSGSESASDPARMNLDELAADLEGIGEVKSDITTLRHVRSRDEIAASEEIANRKPCADFERFRALFDDVQADLKSGTREALPFNKDIGNNTDARIRVGDFYILSGQLAYVAEMGELQRTAIGAPQARLRVIFGNGTESNLLLRSLQAGLYKDEAGRRITKRNDGPLFANQADEGEVATGRVYVLRSKSDHPEIAARRDLIHKIGVTGREVPRRIANASLDPTYLLADVEVVDSYLLYNINRTRLEALLHRLFEPARLDITLKDRFGNPVAPREWFLVPRFVIAEAIERIRDGSITEYTYDPASASLLPTKSSQ